MKEKHYYISYCDDFGGYYKDKIHIDSDIDYVLEILRKSGWKNIKIKVR